MYAVKLMTLLKLMQGDQLAVGQANAGHGSAE